MTWSLKSKEWLGDSMNTPASGNTLWGRRWKIIIANKDDSKTWDVSLLRCVFEVKKSREVRNYAHISIYNLKRDTERAIIMEGDRLIIEAGYGTAEKTASVDIKEMSGGVKNETLQYGKIFDGKIIYPTRHRENNVDYVLTMLVGEGENMLALDWVAQTLQKGQTQRQIVENVCSKAETKIPTASISQNLSPQRLPRGKVLFGKPVDYLRNIARGNNATFWVDNDVVTVRKLTDPNENEAIVLEPKTGLVGMPQQTQFGASWSMLLNPAVKITAKFQLKNTDIMEYQAQPGADPWHPLDKESIYEVIEYTHKGDTWGNEWYTECVGVSRDGKVSIPGLMADSNTNARGG